MTLRSVCIFCGSNYGSEPDYRIAAAALVRALADREIDIVYGGGERGLMGEVAASARERSCFLTGITVQKLHRPPVSLPVADEYLVVETLQERKLQMRSRADAFISLPGGLGTLDEIAETLALQSLGFHDKPSALLNVGGFFDPLLEFLETMTERGFLKRDRVDRLIVSSEPAELVARLAGL